MFTVAARIDLTMSQVVLCCSGDAESVEPVIGDGVLELEGNAPLAQHARDAAPNTAVDF